MLFPITFPNPLPPLMNPLLFAFLIGLWLLLNFLRNFVETLICFFLAIWRFSMTVRFFSVDVNMVLVFAPVMTLALKMMMSMKWRSDFGISQESRQIYCRRSACPRRFGQYLSSFAGGVR